MSFDADRPNNVEHYQCDECGGDIVKNVNGDWECDSCDISYKPSLNEDTETTKEQEQNQCQKKQ